MPDHPTLSKASTPEKITEAAARFEWYERDGADCPAEHIPSEADLAAWLPNCPDAAQAEAREAATAMGLIGPAGDMPAVEQWRWQAMYGYEWKAMEAALREYIGDGVDVDAVLATLESHGAIVKHPRLVFAAGLSVQAGEAVRGVFVWDLVELHRRWTEVSQGTRPQHPLVPIMAAWQGRPREIGHRHVIVPAFLGHRPLVRVPAWLDLASFGEIEAVEVDSKPFATRTATADALRKHTYRRREPVQGELIPGPRKLAGHEVGDVVLRALSRHPLTGDERSPIRGDIYRLALVAFAISGAMTIHPAAGARFIGGRDTLANRARWWAASESLPGLTITIDERTGEWRNLAVVDVEDSGIVHIAAPAWWRGKDRWRLAGGLFRPVLTGAEVERGTTSGYWGGLARTIASFEALLAYGPTAGRGKDGRIPDLLRPEFGKSGPGPWQRVPWRDVLRFSGEHMREDAGRGSREEKRWQRRRDAFESSGYVPTTDRGEATAGDTIEVRPVRGSRTSEAGLMIRASTRFVEAVRKSMDKHAWTRISAAPLFAAMTDRAPD